MNTLKALLILLVVALMPGRAVSQQAQQVPVGIRALGMGGAYTSVADDGSALFWNPAGLPGIGHEEISATHADLYGSGIVDNLASFALPLSLNSAAAIDWYHSGFNDNELNFGETRIDLAYARRVVPWLSLGATAKYLSRDIALDGADVRRGNGVGMDFGLLAKPQSRVRLGLLAQDAFNTRLTYADGLGTALAFPRRLRAGASYAPLDAATIAVDVDDRWHVGVEARPVMGVALRAGLQKEPSDPSGVTWSAGTGIKAGIFRVDYALVDHPTLGTTSNFGVAMEFNFNPSRLRIDEVKPKELYASQYLTYARQPIAKVVVRNLDNVSIDAKIGIVVPGAMSQPSESTVVLPAKATTTIYTTAVLSPNVMNLRESRAVQFNVTASYQSTRTTRREKRVEKGFLHLPGAIDWSRGTAQAAAFVTAGDPVVSTFAGQASRSATLVANEAPVDRNLVNTAAIVDALTAIRFAYVPDQNHPFSSISTKETAYDTIAYPRETLQRRTGDCDDTSALLAALLESVGIATQFVTIPGHIFIMADTGIHERNRVALGFDEKRIVVRDHRVWIPLETTSLNEGFAKAWSEGAELFRAHEGRNDLEMVDVEEALRSYAPVLPPFASDASPAVNPAAFDSTISADLATMRGWRESHLRTLYGGGSTLRPSAAAAIELARINLQGGSNAEAQRILSEALAATPKDPALVANMGAVLAAQGDLAGAASHYEDAVTLDGADPGLWLDLGLVRVAAGDSAGAAKPLIEGVRRSGSYERACDLLSLAQESSGTKEGIREGADSDARRLLQQALRDASQQTPSSASAKSGTGSKLKTSATPLGASQSALLEHLYWKKSR